MEDRFVSLVSGHTHKFTCYIEANKKEKQSTERFCSFVSVLSLWRFLQNAAVQRQTKIGHLHREVYIKLKPVL